MAKIYKKSLAPQDRKSRPHTYCGLGRASRVARHESRVTSRASRVASRGQPGGGSYEPCGHESGSYALPATSYPLQATRYKLLPHARRASAVQLAVEQQNDLPHLIFARHPVLNCLARMEHRSM